MRILRVEHGAYPEISALNADFSPGRTRVRMTLDLGPEVRRQAARFGAPERDGLLSLCRGCRSTSAPTAGRSEPGCSRASRPRSPFPDAPTARSMGCCWLT